MTDETKIAEEPKTVDAARPGANVSVRPDDLSQHWWAALRSSRDDGLEFEAFVQDGREILRRHALFEALSSFMAERGGGTGWTSWPEAYQKPENAEVLAFAVEHGDSVEFQIWQQWVAHQQLSHAAELARKSGMRIGLYLDLAVGEAMDGSATWSERDVYRVVPS
jgi:4-alpha-glucanotransferase